jgi:hypothetical protein
MILLFTILFALSLPVLAIYLLGCWVEYQAYEQYYDEGGRVRTRIRKHKRTRRA